METGNRELPQDSFKKACELWDSGNLKEALQLFLKNAEQGDISSQINVGYFYDTGLGVRKNTEEALSWYRRAYRAGSAGAANNIGTIYRDRGQTQTALQWFKRSLKLGDDDSSLEIAKIYLSRKKQRSSALKYLRIAARSKNVAEVTAEEALKLLKINLSA